jgi:hypothetical protein
MLIQKRLIQETPSNFTKKIRKYNEDIISDANGYRALIFADKKY